MPTPSRTCINIRGRLLDGVRWKADAAERDSNGVFGMEIFAFEDANGLKGMYGSVLIRETRTQVASLQPPGIYRANVRGDLCRVAVWIRATRRVGRPGVPPSGYRWRPCAAGAARRPLDWPFIPTRLPELAVSQIIGRPILASLAASVVQI